MPGLAPEGLSNEDGGATMAQEPSRGHASFRPPTHATESMARGSTKRSNRTRSPTDLTSNELVEFLPRYCAGRNGRDEQ